MLLVFNMDTVINGLIDKYWKELKKKRNVNGFSGTLKPKESEGIIYPDKPSFRIYVEKKLPKELVSLKDLVPKEIDGIPTDIVEIGEVVALSCKDNPRPVRAGCSGMSYYLTATACTVGGFAKNKKLLEEQFIGILANNHCCANENTLPKLTPYTVPSKYDTGDLNDKVGELWRYVELKFTDFKCPYRNTLYKMYRFFKRDTLINRVDIGLVKITIPLSDVIFEVEQIGAPKGKRRGIEGELLHKFGRTTGYTKDGKLYDNDWYGSVRYSRGTLMFGPCGLVMKNGFSAGGDSSSLILAMEDDFLLGNLFAGSNVSTIYCHYDFVESDLEVEYIVP